MHRLPSDSTLRRFRVASVILLVMWLCAPTALGMMGYGFFTRKHEWFGWGGLAVIVGIGCMLLVFMLSGRLRCPLCMMPVMQNRRCSKHRNAGKLLGSYRLKVAMTVLFKDSFRCPYCGEPTAMEVRQRGG